MRRLTLTVTLQQEGKDVNTLLRRQLGLSAGAVRRAKGLPDGILGAAWPSMYTELGVDISAMGLISMGSISMGLKTLIFRSHVLKKECLLLSKRPEDIL